MERGGRGEFGDGGPVEGGEQRPQKGRVRHDAWPGEGTGYF